MNSIKGSWYSEIERTSCVFLGLIPEAAMSRVVTL
uniref:Uncharacterized protein n=1 Tax=Lotus japonicus TaxID=34305 RepID=I3SC39_LOTJA|nr:unknown [Lotus japonicus]